MIESKRIFDINARCDRCGAEREVPYSFGFGLLGLPEGYYYGRSYLGANAHQAGHLACFLCDCSHSEMKEAA